MSYTTLQSMNVCSPFDFMNDKLYFIHEGATVYEYNMNTDTLTAISDGSSFGAGYSISTALTMNGNDRPFCFNGGVYMCAINGGATTFKIFQWSSGTTWTERFSYDYSIWSDSGAHFVFMMTRSGTELILSGVDAVAGAVFSDYIVKYSANGTVWNNGSVSWSSTPSFTATDYSAIGNMTIVGDASRTPVAVGSASKNTSPFEFILIALQWTGTSWSEFYSVEGDFFSPPSSDWLYIYNSGLGSAYPISPFRDLLHWYGQSDYEDADVPSGSQSQPSDPNYYAVMTFNYDGAGKKGFGVKYDGSDLYVAPLDSNHEWETAVEEFVENINDLRYGVRRSDGTPFIVVWNSFRTANAIMSGTESFPDVTPASGNLVWMYRSSDGGLTWSSRGLVT